MNAVIKLSNTQYLQVLQELLLTKIRINDDKISVVKLSFFNFINLLVSIFTQYTKQNTQEPLNIFILNSLQSRCQSAFEFYRQAQGLITMWKKYVECHEQARVFLSVLQPQRSEKQGVKLFLKIRKAILRNIGPKIMQEIQLNHQDVLTLTHTIFTAQMKAFTNKQIHGLFFNLRKKSVYSESKINGAVICQFLMNCSEKFQKQQLDHIDVYLQKNPQQTRDYLQRRVFKPLEEKYQIKIDQSIEQDQSQSVEQESLVQDTSKLRNPLQKNEPRKNEFLVNNLSKTKVSNSLSAEKKVLNSRYENNWQKFLQINKQTKEKLLKPYKNDQS